MSSFFAVHQQEKCSFLACIKNLCTDDVTCCFDFFLFCCENMYYHAVIHLASSDLFFLLKEQVTNLQQALLQGDLLTHIASYSRYRENPVGVYSFRKNVLTRRTSTLFLCEHSGELGLQKGKNEKAGQEFNREFLNFHSRCLTFSEVVTGVIVILFITPSKKQKKKMLPLTST